MKTEKNNTYIVKLTETSDGVVQVNSVQRLVEVLGRDREKYTTVDKRAFTQQHLNTVTKFTAK
jgi:hypothetical protein